MSAVSRCRCRHIRAKHHSKLGMCMTAVGQGYCQCQGFALDDRQIYDDTMAMLRDYIGAHRYAPSVRYMADHFGVAASTVQARLDVLEEAGLIERHGPHAVRLT